ncbi:MAG: 4-hydroxy-tetrahydrodipicolinate synthase [Candidatus Omnitrophica bacterium CG08_land_8_20_14_0_20_41_16]|uniref:4-hydroxy-tetrahydrodipicolinate synthase n=1 Tax=Candidatus Sherwoodlollariibacterium unditelluris TaxID=1974757 RepID=A0A2G9YL67_9BACT|nr:MAG: 4-hydroxy-tetrahydrodipicolinate synthase [Candidatus Omnitrophica bacterium CG23_combo_of_CG06-09_8_20_14_all_41_10]PIS33396.1 MAG: 4-hydroxy-tetrahydrodipicolinate synthase [Candidatus Omnitrophica bacterium CG08_land_8_20_14_0_20_41_16]
MFKGSMVAIVTPFSAATRGGSAKQYDGNFGGKNLVVDEKTFRDLIEFQIKNGTSGIVPCGTTGESATLSFQEHERVIEVTIAQVKKRVPVIAGTGSNSTEEAIMLTKHAEKSGVDASLQVSPYYNRPTQKGLYEHFKAIADSVKIPIILYNIASRTGVNIEPETMAKLACDCKNIVGVKEASGSLEQMSRIKAFCPPDFELISGDDSLTLPVLSIGGTGIISVVANIAPKDTADLVSAFEKGNIKKAQELHYKLLPLIKAMFLETNPMPVKTAMGLLGMCEPDLRLPMCAMLPENLEKLKKALKDYGLFK